MKASLLLSIVAVFIVSGLQNGNSAKILSINFMTGRSHKITYDPLLDELARRGHELTVVSQVPSTKNKTNMRDVLTFDLQDLMKKAPDMFDMKIRGEELNPLNMLYFLQDICRDTYALPQIQELLTQKFDLVLHEPFFSECAAGMLYTLNTSVVFITTVSAPPPVVRVLGGPAPPSFIPSFYSPFDNNMNFVERFRNLVTEVLMSLLNECYIIPKMEALYREALNDPSIPGSAEIFKNASLVLSNSHVILGGARPFMPDIIEVGGMHMKKAKALPKDLEDFVQSSGEHGFIFFSMGSVLQSSQLPESHRKILLNAFSKLKQKVLWKWETDSMPDLPSNVKLIKWAPQQDILGHPKIRAFITHGGLGSTTEAVFHGVPFIGIPIFGDQLTNIEKFIRAGIARRLEFATMTSEEIIQAVEIITSDPKYMQNVKEMSRIYRDQRDDPLERAVYWVEYVLRHQGAVHLRSPARDLNFLQYHSLDVIFVLLAAIFLAVGVVYKVLRKSYEICFGGKTIRNKSLTSKGKKLN